MSENEFVRKSTNPGSYGCLADMELTTRVRKIGDDYFRLSPLKPLLVARTARVMSLAIKPAAPVPIGFQMVDQSVITLPVAEYAFQAGNDPIAIVREPLAIRLNEIEENTAEVVFGEDGIIEWVFKGHAPLDPSWPESEVHILLRLRDMAGLIGFAFSNAS